MRVRLRVPVRVGVRGHNSLERRWLRLRLGPGLRVRVREAMGTQG